MSDLYACWYHKIFKFAGLVIQMARPLAVLCRCSLTQAPRTRRQRYATVLRRTERVHFKTASQQARVHGGLAGQDGVQAANCRVILLQEEAKNFVKVSAVSNDTQVSRTSTEMPADQLTWLVGLP